MVLEKGRRGTLSRPSAPTCSLTLQPPKKWELGEGWFNAPGRSHPVHLSMVVAPFPQREGESPLTLTNLRGCGGEGIWLLARFRLLQELPA